MRIIFDASSAASHRRLDENGFLHVSACPISSHGVFDYARSEAGLPGDPNELVKVMRPESAISSPEFIASCQNLPMIDDHTYVEGVIQDSDFGEESGVDPAKKGVCGVLTNVRYDPESGWVLGDVAIYARQMIRQIMADEKTELSLGYTCIFTPTDGEKYAATQTGMTGNHLALVDRARVPGARVLDSAFPYPSNEDESMSKKTKARALDSSAVDKLRELLLPALQQFLSEEAEEPEHQEELAGNEPDIEAQDPELAEEPALDPAASEEADPVTEDEDGDDGDIVALLQQLLSALQPAAAGDENPAEDPALAEDDLSGAEPTAEPGVTMDAMFKAVANRDAVYGRVSKVVGAFDHATMTAEKVAQYGVKKLGLKCASGQELIVLDAYLGGLEAASKQHPSTKKAGDAASSAELDAYLSAKK